MIQRIAPGDFIQAALIFFSLEKKVLIVRTLVREIIMKFKNNVRCRLLCSKDKSGLKRTTHVCISIKF